MELAAGQYRAMQYGKSMLVRRRPSTASDQCNVAPVPPPTPVPTPVNLLGPEKADGEGYAVSVLASAAIVISIIYALQVSENR
jgi:hypothetical protein